MALDINGYNTDFNAFVKFAQNSFVTIFGDRPRETLVNWAFARFCVPGGDCEALLSR